MPADTIAALAVTAAAALYLVKRLRPRRDTCHGCAPAGAPTMNPERSRQDANFAALPLIPSPPDRRRDAAPDHRAAASRVGKRTENGIGGKNLADPS
jgi:hypothetical protein